MYLAPPAIGFPYQLGKIGWPLRNYIGAIRSRKIVTISLAVWIKYTNMTDRHRPTARTALTHSVAR